MLSNKGRKAENIEKIPACKKIGWNLKDMQTFIWMTENNITNAYNSKCGLLECILSPQNLNAAFKRVKSNKGSGGIDKMEVESLGDYLVAHKDSLIQSILDAKFRPNPVRQADIPKNNGQKRSLGNPHSS